MVLNPLNIVSNIFSLDSKMLLKPVQRNKFGMLLNCPLRELWSLAARRRCSLFSFVDCCCRRHKSCSHPKFENGHKYKLTFFNRLVWMRKCAEWVGIALGRYIFVFLCHKSCPHPNLKNCNRYWPTVLFESSYPSHFEITTPSWMLRVGIILLSCSVLYLIGDDKGSIRSNYVISLGNKRWHRARFASSVPYRGWERFGQ